MVPRCLHSWGCPNFRFGSNWRAFLHLVICAVKGSRIPVAWSFVLFILKQKSTPNPPSHIWVAPANTKALLKMALPGIIHCLSLFSPTCFLIQIMFRKLCFFFPLLSSYFFSPPPQPPSLRVCNEHLKQEGNEWRNSCPHDTTTGPSTGGLHTEHMTQNSWALFGLGFFGSHLKRKTSWSLRTVRDTLSPFSGPENSAVLNIMMIIIK